MSSADRRDAGGPFSRRQHLKRAPKSSLPAKSVPASQSSSEPVDHRAALTGLAALARVDPGEVIKAYEEAGGPLARLIEGLLHLAPRGRGRPALDDAGAAERYVVVETLRACGLKGRRLDEALEEVGTGNITPASYRRAAARFEGSLLVAMFVDTDAVRRAQAWADRHREMRKK